MSGGSYDYLCDAAYTKDAGELGKRLHLIRAMGERLAKTPNGAVAAQQTMRVAEALEKAVRLATPLADVWHAVEWEASGDSGEEEIQTAIAAHDKAALQRLLMWLDNRGEKPE